MTPDQFVRWMEGFLEGTGLGGLNGEQLKVVRDRLSTVLTNVTRSESSSSQRNPLESAAGRRLICDSVTDGVKFC